jgi:hypothetical protein
MATHKCSTCGHAFSVPNWLDTEIKCPKCASKAQKLHEAAAAPMPSQLPPSVQTDEAPAGASASAPAARTAPAVPPTIATNRAAPALARWLNDSRLRSALAGAVGGFLGCLIAELLFAGSTGFFATVFVGGAVGLGIAAVLGAAEGVVIGSWTLAKRGFLIGATAGAMGGAVGATCGQLTYLVAAPASPSSGHDNESGSFMRPAFSREVAERIEREGGETGEIEIALIWHNRNDLDLHVVDPRGEEIFFDHTRSESGGWLDIDQNAGCRRTTNEPIEHVRWMASNAPEGEFRVSVNHFANCGQTDPTDFRVEVKNGNQVQSFDGTIAHGEPKKLVHTFTRGADSTAAEPPQPKPRFELAVLLAVMCGWLLFGVVVGCAEGLTRKSLTALRNAALGGAIGGALGGMALLLVAGAVTVISGAVAPGVQEPHAGWFGRMLGFVILGACIGLWIVLIKRVLSAALFVCSGPQEGREVFLDKSEMRIGRNDALEVYLGGDAEVLHHHATIRQDGNCHVILAADGTVAINGQTVSRRELKHGDAITLGKTRLTYRRKAGAPDTPDARAVS